MSAAAFVSPNFFLRRHSGGGTENRSRCDPTRISLNLGRDERNGFNWKGCGWSILDRYGGQRTQRPKNSCGGTRLDKGGKMVSEIDLRLSRRLTNAEQIFNHRDVVHRKLVSVDITQS